MRGMLEKSLRLLAVPQVSSVPPVGLTKRGVMEKPTSELRLISGPETDGNTKPFDSKQNAVNVAKKHKLMSQIWLSQNIYLCSLSINTVNLLFSFRTFGFHCTSTSRANFQCGSFQGLESRHWANGQLAVSCWEEAGLFVWMLIMLRTLQKQREEKICLALHLNTYIVIMSHRGLFLSGAGLINTSQF